MQALRYAKGFKPRWLVMENVVHMRPWSRYGELKQSLEDLGYNIREFKLRMGPLDASDFGTPQSRRRLFIVGDRSVTPTISLPGRKATRNAACIVTIDLTRPSRDGGRDGIGKLNIGRGPSAVLVDFALEAKCYGEGNSIGVREMSRLISRLRHRQFGILVTTSYVDSQAYREIKEDQHPIVVIAAADIVGILRSHGYAGPQAVENWLNVEFPSAPQTSLAPVA
jgi:site-specific DNA-cytosine methylase